MLIKRGTSLKSSDITEKKLYLNRRQFMASSAALAASCLFPPKSIHGQEKVPQPKLKIARRREHTGAEKITPVEDATGFVNFYEFSTSKRGIAELASDFRTRPWSVAVEGLVKKPKIFDIEELIQMFPLEECIYRWRCVEAWSMVIPWIGFPLAEFINKCEPIPKASFVEFTTIYDPEQMPGQQSNVLDWPYVEGLRMDEARHPLALLAVGMYGEILPNQNGAPLRLVVPWKYGFKSSKSIVRIRFVDQMPKTAWNKKRPTEYGFYANVNPKVDHPRWSQATERRIGESGKRKTLMFNGYAEEVGSLYSGMNLKKFY